MASNNYHSDNENSDSEHEAREGRRSQSAREDGELEQESEQARFFRKINFRRRARPGDTCFFCGRLGHWQVDCPEKTTSRKCKYLQCKDYDHDEFLFADEYVVYNSFYSPRYVYDMCHDTWCFEDNNFQNNTSYSLSVSLCSTCHCVKEFCTCLYTKDSLSHHNQNYMCTELLHTRNSPSFAFLDNIDKCLLKIVSNPSSMSSVQSSSRWTTNFLEYESHDVNISVVGRLRHGYDFMKEIGCSDHILRVISHGYVLPFIRIPAPVFLKNNLSSRKHPKFVRSAIDELVASGAVVETLYRPTVVNPLTVSVRNDKFRLVLDLRYINKLINLKSMKFEGAETFLKYISKDNWMFTFDLKSGYHHIQIVPGHRQFLGFSYTDSSGKVRFFIFTVLPFGLSSAGFIFSKVLRELVRYWRSRMIL